MDRRLSHKFVVGVLFLIQAGLIFLGFVFISPVAIYKDNLRMGPPKNVCNTFEEKIEQHSNEPQKTMCPFHGSVRPEDHPVEGVRYVMGCIIGGLGNQLWIYASTYGISRKSNHCPLVCSCESRLFRSDMFPGLTVPAVGRERCKILRDRFKKRIGQAHSPMYYSDKTVELARDSQEPIIGLLGYLQNLGFFVEYEKEIKKEFILSDTLKRYADDMLHKLATTMRDEVNKPARVYVGIHIRRGGMLDFKGIIAPDAAYFSKAMKYFRKRYGRGVIFVVMTLDKKWAEKNLEGSDFYYTSDLGPKKQAEDFAIGVACNHTIMSLGTYGWWIGFLGGGEVIYFKNFAGTSKYAKWYFPHQRFPYNWIGM